jgi:hypothetical protein
MQRPLPRLIGLGLAIFLVACRGEPSPVLPTATPGPTQPIPTSTPTPLPPPTVTPFPTRATSGESPPLPETQPVTGGATTPEGSEQLPTSTPAVAPTAGVAEPQNTPPQASPPTQAAQASSGGGFPPGVATGSRVFYADFYQGWPSINDETARLYIYGGRYIFEIGPFDARFMATTAVDRRDIYTQVEAAPDTCPTGGGYGLLFRFVDAGNYYLVTIFCDNTFSVSAKVGGTIVGGVFADGPLPGGVDATGPVAHKLGVLSQGDAHTLYFDGQTFAEFTDAAHEQGDVALYAISQGNAVLQVAFDNLEVWTVR